VEVPVEVPVPGDITYNWCQYFTCVPVKMLFNLALQTFEIKFVMLGYHASSVSGVVPEGITFYVIGKTYQTRHEKTSQLDPINSGCLVWRFEDV
jgi:hypothetical protein